MGLISTLDVLYGGGNTTLNNSLQKAIKCVVVPWIL